MWRSLSDGLHRFSNGWVALASLVIFLLFSALVLPSQASRAQSDIGDAGSPDLSFFYSEEELYQMAERYGEEGRAAYIKARFTFDLIWPLVYAAFLAAGISWTNRKAFPLDSRWQQANIIPILGAFFDYLENVSTSIVMARYPSQTVVLDVSAAIFTMLKWIFVTGSFVLLVIGVVVGVSRWARARRRQ